MFSLLPIKKLYCIILTKNILVFLISEFFFYIVAQFIIFV